jgi:hypothetical protein
MEHRYCPRIKETLTVSLWHGGEWWGTYTTENISLDGLFLQISPMDKHEIIRLRRNPLVKICVECLGTRHCMSAFVVHRSGQGLGLMLAPPDPEYTNTVLKLLNQQLQSPTQNVVRHGNREDPPPPSISGSIW